MLFLLFFDLKKLFLKKTLEQALSRRMREDRERARMRAQAQAQAAGQARADWCPAAGGLTAQTHMLTGLSSSRTAITGGGCLRQPPS
jgi:regulator of protease activity HflC (stomatin/prohibitin superfamily)